MRIWWSDLLIAWHFFRSIRKASKVYDCIAVEFAITPKSCEEE